MRYCLVCLLMLLFSLQVVPVKKIGKLLCKTQSTEEVQNKEDVADYDAQGNIGLFNNDLIHNHPSFDPLASSSHFEKAALVSIHKAEVLPLILVTKIPSPPPEC